MTKNELSIADVYRALRSQDMDALTSSQTIGLTHALNKALAEPEQTNYALSVKCVGCKRTYYVAISKKGYHRWTQGTLIQEALPELSVEERELLISKTCNACFDALFAEPDEDDGVGYPYSDEEEFWNRMHGSGL